MIRQFAYVVGISLLSRKNTKCGNPVSLSFKNYNKKLIKNHATLFQVGSSSGSNIIRLHKAHHTSLKPNILLIFFIIARWLELNHVLYQWHLVSNCHNTQVIHFLIHQSTEALLVPFNIVPWLAQKYLLSLVTNSVSLCTLQLLFIGQQPSKC